MSKQIALALFALWLPAATLAQPAGREPLYEPTADPARELAQNLARAAAEGKHVLLMIGGNWCKWCYRFHDFLAADAALDSLRQAAYVTQRVNHSKENPNLYFLESLGFPQRFGFPVFVVLDASGQRLHIQDSAVLESGAGYDAGKVKRFLQLWAPAALDPARYRDP
jgi:thioredoxin-related protein